MVSTDAPGPWHLVNIQRHPINWLHEPRFDNTEADDAAEQHVPADGEQQHYVDQVDDLTTMRQVHLQAHNLALTTW